MTNNYHSSNNIIGAVASFGRNNAKSFLILLISFAIAAVSYFAVWQLIIWRNQSIPAQETLNTALLNELDRNTAPIGIEMILTSKNDKLPFQTFTVTMDGEVRPQSTIFNNLSVTYNTGFLTTKVDLKAALDKERNIYIYSENSQILTGLASVFSGKEELDNPGLTGWLKISRQEMLRLATTDDQKQCFNGLYNYRQPSYDKERIRSLLSQAPLLRVKTESAQQFDGMLVRKLGIDTSYNLGGKLTKEYDQAFSNPEFEKAIIACGNAMPKSEDDADIADPESYDLNIYVDVLHTKIVGLRFYAESPDIKAELLIKEGLKEYTEEITPPADYHQLSDWSEYGNKPIGA